MCDGITIDQLHIVACETHEPKNCKWLLNQNENHFGMTLRWFRAVEKIWVFEPYFEEEAVIWPVYVA